jgi:hypothetical protein
MATASLTSWVTSSTVKPCSAVEFLITGYLFFITRNAKRIHGPDGIPGLSIFENKFIRKYK